MGRAAWDALNAAARAGGEIVHLAYRTNVHPAEDLAGINGQLSGVAAKVRGLTGAARLGLGLWLSRRAARALRDDPARLVRLRRRLFMDPADPLVKLRAATALARKKLGFRYTVPVVPLDPAPVRGSHGRLPDSAADGPVLLGPFRDAYDATEVKGLLTRFLKG